MGLLEFANEIAPPKEEKKKSGLLEFADQVAPRQDDAAPRAAQAETKKPGRASDIVAFAESLVPTTRQGVLEKMAPDLTPEAKEFYASQEPPSPPFMMRTPEGREYPAPPTTGFTRVGGMLGKQIPGFKPLTESLSGKPGVWEEIAPKGTAEKVLGAGIDFAGFLAGPAKAGGLVAKPLVKGVEKVAGQGLTGAILKYATQHGVSLGTATVLSELSHGASIKDAVKAFGPGAVMGEIFGLTGLAAFKGHPVLSQAIRQVGGRVLLGLPTDKEAWSPENIGPTVFHELMNTYFLSHGARFADVFGKGLAHTSAVKIIESIPKAERPTPEVVKAAGGPAAWLAKELKPMADALAGGPQPEPVKVLLSQDERGKIQPPPREQMAIPGMEPPPVRPEPFRPESLEGRQGVLPMPEASPLFKGTEPIETRRAKAKEKMPWEMTLEEFANQSIEVLRNETDLAEPTAADVTEAYRGQLAMAMQDMTPIPRDIAVANLKWIKEYIKDPASAYTLDLRGEETPYKGAKVRPSLTILEPDGTKRTLYGLREIDGLAKSGTAKNGPDTLFSAEMPSEERRRPRLQDRPLPAQRRIPEEGVYITVRTDDGGLYFLPEAEAATHYDLVRRLGIPPERVIGGGFIKDGDYIESPRSEAGKIGRDAREALGLPREVFFDQESDVLTRELLEDRRRNPHKRLQEGKDRAAELSHRGEAGPKKLKGPSKLTDKAVREGVENKVIEETRQAILEGATNYDALDPAYKKLLEKRLSPSEVEALKQGIDYHGLSAAERINFDRRLEGLPEGREKLPPVTTEAEGLERFLERSVPEKERDLVRDKILEHLDENPKLREAIKDRIDKNWTWLQVKEAAEKAAKEAKKAAKATKPPAEPEPIPAAIGRAPQSLGELESELVRINDGRVSREQASALGALVKGVAKYKGMTPDEYVAARFAELRGGEAPPDVTRVVTAEDRAKVIKDCHDRGIRDSELIQKVLNGEPIASVEFLSDGRAILRAFRKSNIAGMAHELGHIFRRDLSAAERAIVERALKVNPRTGWDRFAEERWAKQFELYLKHGTAPNPELNGVYAKFKKWVGSIYKNSSDMFNKTYRLNPELRQVFDKMIGGKEIPVKTTEKSTKSVGRMPKAAGVAEIPSRGTPGGTFREVPQKGEPPIEWEKAASEKPTHGPILGGGAESAADPVVKTLGPKGASITRSFLESLKQLPKLPAKLSDVWKNPIYIFEKVPFLKEHIYDKKVDADAGHAKAVKKLHLDINRWKFNTKALKDQSGQRLWIYAIAKQEGGLKVLEAEGLSAADIPKLSREEMEVYKEVRDNLEHMWGRINEARDLLGLERIGKIQNYFTFLRKLPELESLSFDPILDPDAKALTEALKAQAEPAFFKHRGKKSEGAMEQNFYKVYESYMRKASNYVENAPVVAALHLITEPTIIPAKKKGQKPDIYSMFKENNHLFTWLRQWGNFATGHKVPGVVSELLKEHPGAIRVVQAVNRNLATGVLSANIRSALIQPSALRNSYIELGRRWLGAGAKAVLEKGGRAEIMKMSRVLWGREFDIHAAAVAEGPSTRLGKVSNAKWKLAEWGITPLKALDMVTAQITWAGAHARATAPVAKGGLGLTGREAVKYADDVVTKTQASAAPRDVAPIQRSLEGRMATMLQSFVINEWNYLSQNVVGIGNENLKGKAKAVAMMRLAVATALINVIYEDLLQMRSPFPTPEHALIGGIAKGDRLGRVLVDTLTEPLEQIPGIGGALRWSTEKKTMLPAVLQAYEDMFRLYGKTKRAISEGDPSVFRPEDLSAPFRLLGIPGVSQVEKTMRRREMKAPWLHAILGQKIEALEEKPGKSQPLDPATEALLKKYGLSGEEPRGKKKKQKKADTREVDAILKKYGLL